MIWFYFWSYCLAASSLIYFLASGDDVLVFVCAALALLAFSLILRESNKSKSRLISTQRSLIAAYQGSLKAQEELIDSLLSRCDLTDLYKQAKEEARAKAGK